MLVTPCIGRTIRLCTKSLVHDDDVDDDNNNTEILLLTSLPLCTCPPGCRAVSEHSHVATSTGVAEGDVGGRVHDVSERKRVLTTTTQTSLNTSSPKEGGGSRRV